MQTAHACPPPEAPSSCQGGAPADGPASAEALTLLSRPEGPGELGRLGGYRILKLMGRGGMGVVYHAEDPVLNRPVALKVMSPAAAAEPASRERFLREAKATAAVEDDHIVAIFQVGEDRGVPFLAMPLLRGESLEQRLGREGKLPVAEVLRIGRGIAAGLHAAHRHGLTHRDVKPGNVWLEAGTGRVKLFDFGLALTGRESARLTQSGCIVGTPAYMAPEQARGGEVDARADLFSLGCILYRAATGRAPFAGDDVLTVLTALAVDSPPPPALVDPAIPEALSDFIMRLLAKDPVDRPAPAGLVAETLRAVAARPVRPAKDAPQVGTPAGPPPTPPQASGPPRRRHRLWAAVVIVGLMAAGVAGWLPGRSGDTAPSAPADGGAAAAAEVGLPALEARAALPGADAAALADEARAWWREHAATADGVRAAALLRRLPSPLDRLDPRQAGGKPADLPGLVALLGGHQGPVGSVAFSPDGRTLASGGGEQDQNVAVWDLGGPAPRLRSAGERLGNAVSTVAFSPDGRNLAASLWDGTVRLWDARPDVPRPAGVLRGPAACFTCMALAGDGRGLAAGTDRGVVWVWDLGQAPGKARTLRPEGFGIVSGVAFGPQGRALAAAGADVRLWDLGGKDRPEAVLPGAGQAEARGLAFSADGRALAAGFNTGAVHLWDVAGAPGPGPWLRRHTDQVRALAFSPDGRLLASGGWDGRVVLWAAAGGTRRREWQVSGEHVTGVAFAPDSRHLAFAAGNKVYVLRLAPAGEP
jgi:hypothetical protein